MNLLADGDTGAGGAPRATLPTQMPFVGRIRELDALVALLDGDRGSCVLISGAAGVGKTRLAAEAAQRVAGPRPVATITATTALSEIPFGVFATMLGGLDHREVHERGALGQTEFLALAHDVVGEQLRGSVLVVDDAALLDPGSALLLSFFLAVRWCPVILTNRNGAPLPDPVQRLWMDDAIDTLELEPLPADDVASLCGAVMGGPVEDRTVVRLGQACAGNLLYLRELLHSGFVTGQLDAAGGPWRWDGRLTVTPRLAELIGRRLVGASPDATRLLRLVSLAEPLPLEPLVSLCGPAAVEEAEGLGYLLVLRDGRRTVARLAHPLYGEALREIGGHAEARRLAGELAAALARRDLRRSGDTLRLAVLEMRSGHAVDDERLVVAATRARTLGDLELAIELARTAVAIDDTGRARLELVECLFWHGRPDEAIAVARDLDTSSLDQDDLVRLSVNLASIRYFSGQPLETALEALDDAERHLTDPARVARIRAHRAELFMFSGQVGPASRIAETVLGEPASSAVTRAVAYGALAPSLALGGRVERARAISDEGLAVLLADPDPPLADGAGIVVGGFLAGIFGCRLDEATRMVESLRGEALHHPADPMLGVWSLMLGRSHLCTGPLPLAVELLTEAAALFRASDPSRLLAWALGSLAQARAMAGDGAGASLAVAEMEQVRDQNIGAFALDRELGRAWNAAASGRVDDARSIVVDAVGVAREHEAFGVAAFAVFEAYRLGAGRPALRRAWGPGGPLEGPLLPLAVTIATSRNDPSELLTKADRLRDLGARVWACDVAAIASNDARAVGDHAGAARALLWLDAHAAEIGTDTPAVMHARLTADRGQLTGRERELLRLVMAGRSNQEIAVALYISRRTVESHLHHIFKKLGVSSRDELIGPVEGAVSEA